MAVTIKSPREIACMREAGRLLAEVHEELGAMIRPGISTKDIDRARGGTWDSQGFPYHTGR